MAGRRSVSAPPTALIDHGSTLYGAVHASLHANLSQSAPCTGLVWLSCWHSALGPLAVAPPMAAARQSLRRPCEHLLSSCRSGRCLAISLRQASSVDGLPAAVHAPCQLQGESVPAPISRIPYLCAALTRGGPVRRRLELQPSQPAAPRPPAASTLPARRRYVCEVDVVDAARKSRRARRQLAWRLPRGAPPRRRAGCGLHAASRSGQLQQFLNVHPPSEHLEIPQCGHAGSARRISGWRVRVMRGWYWVMMCEVTRWGRSVTPADPITAGPRSHRLVMH